MNTTEVQEEVCSVWRHVDGTKEKVTVHDRILLLRKSIRKSVCGMRHTHGLGSPPVAAAAR